MATENMSVVFTRLTALKISLFITETGVLAYDLFYSFE